MPKYKIVTGEPVSEPDSDPVVELRLVLDGSHAVLEARNPGHGWSRIVRFKPDGRLMLLGYAGDVAGLETNDRGEIVTY